MCREEAKAKRARGEEGLDYVYVGQSSESCYTRGVSHQADMRAGLQGKLDTSHMAAHINSVHGGRKEGAKFVMKKVKSYPTSFLRILAECIRIKYRSEEKGIMVMNQKSGDFGSYSLPRLSVFNSEVPRDDGRESRGVDISILNAKRKGRIKLN